MAKRPVKARRVTKRPPPVPARPPVDGRLPAGIALVGVGASAGGLEAFTQLLQSLDPEAGLTVVLVQHLSPHHDSALVDLLRAHTSMPLTEVIDGVRIQANHVYVIPPNVQMVLSGDALELSPRPDDRRAHAPIDNFFASLAAVAGDQSIAVVLSGTASDGAIGIREVKAAGGITFAQAPASAKFDGMPRAAIATGMVDVVMTPAEIGEELSQIARHPYARLPARADGHTIDDDQLQRVFALLRPASGVDFRHYKLPTVKRRLLRRMALHRISNVQHYVELLEKSPEEVRGLFQDLLIHVTRFFREPESFEALAAEVFPKLVEGKDPDRAIRAWVCGCATGEEPYSLAMVLLEFLQQRQSTARIQIFATDVSDTAIEHARVGVYPASIADDVGAERLRRFFLRSDGHYRVSKQIRDLCVFARQDLTRDPPFSRLDLVMCRNVLIYMNPVLQRKLIGMFYYALHPNGHLVLGQAESVGPQMGLFSLVDKRARIYRKKSDYGVERRETQPREYPLAPALPRPPAGQPSMDPDRGMQVEVSRLILDRYSPAGVVVDSDLQIVQVRGQTGAFLEPAPGDASLSLLKMLREGLLYGVRSAFHAARKSRRSARRDGLRVRSGDGWREVNVEVMPLSDSARQHYLVLFDEVRQPASARQPARKGKGAKKKATSPASPSRELLQRELDASRQYMQTIIQELEAANEELQSANEEILSSNEELQSTNEELDTAKEELQSTNEELNTVNEELHARNDELSRANSDLVNLVGSVQIAIVIVGSDLRIRRFTPMAERVLNLIPADLDRSIAHINPNLDLPNLAELIIECMDTVAPLERDVRDRKGHWFALRIRPYKNLDNKIDGAVLALFDIDILKRSEQSARRAEAFADGLLDVTTQPTAIVDPQLRLQRVNASFAQLLGAAPADLGGRILAEVKGLSALEAWQSAATRMTPGQTLPTVTLQAATPPRPLSIDARAVPSPEFPDQTLLVVTVHDGGKS
jgi:two-component system CheB/CheR fusion protein